MASQPRTNGAEPGTTESTFTRSVIDTARMGVLVTLGVLLSATTSVSAQAEGSSVEQGASLLNELGTFLGSNGGGMVMVVFWVFVAGYIFWQGVGRLITAFEHLGALDEGTISQGRTEGVQALKTFLLAVLGVPLIAAFVGRVFPDSWSWMGVDVTQYISLPGTGGGGGGEAQQAAGMIHVPVDEIVTTVDLLVTALPALV